VRCLPGDRRGPGPSTGVRRRARTRLEPPFGLAQFVLERGDPFTDRFDRLRPDRLGGAFERADPLADEGIGRRTGHRLDTAHP
jgi:hypothetical protein